MIHLDIAWFLKLILSGIGGTETPGCGKKPCSTSSLVGLYLKYSEKSLQPTYQLSPAKTLATVLHWR